MSDIPKWQQRREIESVLNPRGTVIYPHLQRAIDLAVAYAWNVAPCAHSEQRAVYRTYTIYTPPITGDQELAAFAHEGGHLEHGDDDVPIEQTFVAELGAWLFAINRLGFRWNQRMNDYMGSCLWTYRPDYVLTNANRRTMEALISYRSDKTESSHAARSNPTRTISPHQPVCEMTTLELDRLKEMNPTDSLAHVIVTAIKAAVSGPHVKGKLDALEKRLADLEARLPELEQRPTMKFVGIWDGSTRFTYGQVVTFDGSMWHCNCPTRDKPGTSNDWTMCVRRGKDGKDLRDQR